MKNVTCRRLIQDDSTEVETLWVECKTLFKDEYIRKPENLQKYFADDNLKLFGLFLDGRLIAAAGVKLWGNMPFYTLLDLVSAKDELIGVRSVRNLNLLLEFVLAQMEADHRFTFYVATIARSKQLKAFLKNYSMPNWGFLNALDRYDCYVEAICKPGERSPFSVFDSLLGFRAHARQTWIRRYSLKLEHRAW